MTGKPRKRAAALPVANTCCVAGCGLVVFKRGLCSAHHEDLSSRAGPFARTPPQPQREPGPQPASPVKTGDDAWERLKPV